MNPLEFANSPEYVAHMLIIILWCFLK